MPRRRSLAFPLPTPSSRPSWYDSTNQATRSSGPTPLPKLQLFVLCLMRMTEPISFTVIFPFINQMVHRNLPDVPLDELGYYGGLVESAFAFVQFLTIFSWGRLSDSIGRKPVLLIGLTGNVISMNLFGLSRSLPAMIVSRSVAGLMNGNIAVLKSVLGEITDETNQARAFALIPMCYAVGSIVGPSLGGYLADPARTFPELFGGSKFLQDFPYFLPCFIASLFNLAGILVGFFFLEETLPAKVRRKGDAPTDAASGRIASGQDDGGGGDDRHGEGGGDEERQGTEPRRSRTSIKRLVTPSIANVLFTQFSVNLLNACHAAVLPLFCFESVANGGIGLTNLEIGHLMAINGVMTIFMQVIVFPGLERRLGGAVKTYRSVVIFMPLVFLCLPLAHQLGAMGGVGGGKGKSTVWAALMLMILLKGFSNMAIVCSTMIVSNLAPSRSLLGALNGVSQMCGSLARTFGPTASNSLFALSVSRHLVGGQLVWIVLCLYGLFAWSMTLRVKAPSKALWRMTPDELKRYKESVGEVIVAED
ncbi:MFS general substrate transporter [Violaceomyces palustris]|uniref:MFS general substrate transporter n=1 Tax=Violaceomyces palustris TaxID=1673888 RepID=A0ACD0NLX6_9BASI|nr:MFS general substrate transporter [Violaceomyces palustris]